MNRGRRRFLQASLGGTTALMSGHIRSSSESGNACASKGDNKALRILILGGTGFIGPHMVQEALRRGHNVTLFNRGRTARDLFPDLELLVGDRDNELGALRGRTWDAVVDNSGYVPRHVADSATLLSSAVSHYLFVSSVSAYAAMSGNATAAKYHDVDMPNTEYGSPLAAMPDESVEEVTSLTYGPLKVLCERAVTEVMEERRVTILRPTWVVGPGDTSDRLTYWPVRVARGGEVLVPGTSEDLLQIIDVRDLAIFVVDSVERRLAGIFNMVTAPGSYSMGRFMLDNCALTRSDASLTWVDLPFIIENELLKDGTFGIWAPPSGDTRSDAIVSSARSFEHGLRARPPRETIRDTLGWWWSLSEERRRDMHAGLSADREARLLAAWRMRAS